MSEPRFESILREAAPPAPQQLRDRVRALPEPANGRPLNWRPALAAAALIAVAVGIGVAAIGGLTRSTRSVEHGAMQDVGRSIRAPVAGSSTMSRGMPARKSVQFNGQVLAPTQRLQLYGVSMRIRVRDLSAATQSAVNTTRKLDGYVASADYSTGGSTGDSVLDLRVPRSRVQQAIASFTNLGTILSQQISVADLQQNLDRVDRSLAAARKIVSQLGGRTNLTAAEKAQLDAAKRTVSRLTQSHSRLVREGTYARISLSLTTRKAPAKQAVPGRFDRFWSDAGDILGKEAIVMLYALVVAGPFAILAVLAFFGERARRRRADGRLLEETG